MNENDCCSLGPEFCTVCTLSLAILSDLVALVTVCARKVTAEDVVLFSCCLAPTLIKISNLLTKHSKDEESVLLPHQQ